MERPGKFLFFSKFSVREKSEGQTRMSNIPKRVSDNGDAFARFASGSLSPTLRISSRRSRQPIRLFVYLLIDASKGAQSSGTARSPRMCFIESYKSLLFGEGQFEFLLFPMRARPHTDALAESLGHVLANGRSANDSRLRFTALDELWNSAHKTPAWRCSHGVLLRWLAYESFGLWPS